MRLLFVHQQFEILDLCKVNEQGQHSAACALGQSVAQQAEENVLETLTDFYEQLDPGIREIVRYIRREGFVTTDSGDGKTKPPGPDVLPYPHVAVQVPVMPTVISHADHLRRVMQCGEPIGKVPAGWQVQLTYDPATDHTRTLIMVTWPRA